jgi:hypothetical protein
MLAHLKNGSTSRILATMNIGQGSMTNNQGRCDSPSISQPVGFRAGHSCRAKLYGADLHIHQVGAGNPRVVQVLLGARTRIQGKIC